MVSRIVESLIQRAYFTYFTSNITSFFNNWPSNCLVTLRAAVEKPSNLLSPALFFGFTGKVMACAVMQPGQI
jgi:hypothetical protein